MTITLNQAQRALSDLMMGDKAETYTVNDIRNILLQVSTEVDGASPDSIYLLYSGTVSGRESYSVAQEIVATGGGKYVDVSETPAGQFISRSKRLFSNVHHIVIRVTDHYLPKIKGGRHPIEKSDTLEQNLVFRFMRYLKKVWLLLVVSFLMIPGYSIAEETMCRDLKRVNNLDELLYQFYINLDSDCLFTTPLSELEAAWGIKILSEEHLQLGQTPFELRENTDFRGKPYHSEIDAFFVEAEQWDGRTMRFTIYIAKAYYEKYATLFPEGNYPKLIPDPVEELLEPPPQIELPPLGSDLPRRPQFPGKYNNDYIYYWLNANRTHMIYIWPGAAGSVERINVYGQIPPGF